MSMATVAAVTAAAGCTTLLFLAARLMDKLQAKVEAAESRAAEAETALAQALLRETRAGGRCAALQQELAQAWQGQEPGAQLTMVVAVREVPQPLALVTGEKVWN